MGKYGARETLIRAGAICEAIIIHSINASVYQRVLMGQPHILITVRAKAKSKHLTSHLMLVRQNTC